MAFRLDLINSKRVRGIVMLKKSPTGALSPYYYKGGYFHGIHYGSLGSQMDKLLGSQMDKLGELMAAEEEFILNSPEKRRLMIDLYETDLTPVALMDFTAHIRRLRDRIIKLGVSADKKTLGMVRKALQRDGALGKGQMYFAPDMEETKTWLVTD